MVLPDIPSGASRQMVLKPQKSSKAKTGNLMPGAKVEVGVGV